MVPIVDGEAPPGCPACGRQMRHAADFEIYECRECRIFVNETVKIQICGLITSRTQGEVQSGERLSAKVGVVSKPARDLTDRREVVIEVLADEV